MGIFANEIRKRKSEAVVREQETRRIAAEREQIVKALAKSFAEDLANEAGDYKLDAGLTLLTVEHGSDAQFRIECINASTFKVWSSATPTWSEPMSEDEMAGAVLDWLQR